MKKFIGTLAGAVLMFLACSPDEENHYHQQVDGSVPHLERIPLSPGNGDNPYDYMGRMYQEALLRYLNDRDAASSKGPGQEIGDFVPWQTLTALLTDSGLSPKARTSLLGFVETILTQQHEGYPALFGTIVDFETSVMNNSDFTIFDKQIILSFASLIRHATYPRVTVRTTSEVEDEDWDLSVANAIGLIHLALVHTNDQDTSSLVLSLDTGPLIHGQ